MATRRRLPLRDLEFVQFHPTGIFPEEESSCETARVNPSWPRRSECQGLGLACCGESCRDDGRWTEQRGPG